VKAGRNPGSRSHGRRSDEHKRQQALQAFQLQQWQRAQTLYRELCTANPADANAWLMLGAISGQGSNYPEAERCFRKALKLMPGSAPTLDNLGNALAFQGKFDAAEQCYRKALQQDPRQLSAYTNLGNLLWRRGEVDAAAKQFQAALRLNPDYAEAHNSLGLVLRESGDRTGAIRHFEKAIGIQPAYADAHHNLADSFKLDGDFDRALRHYRKAISLQPGLAASHTSLASLYEELKYTGQALEHFQTALRIDPRLPDAITGVARIKADEGRHDEARELLEANIRRLPDNPDIAATLAGILIRQGERDRAGELLEPFIKQRETDPRIALAYAALNQRTDKRPEAIELLEHALQDKQITTFQKETVGHALGQLYEREQQYDKAFSACALANRARTEESDLQRHLTEMQTIRETFSADLLASNRRATICDSRPLFIVGMPRSGTSLVEQILASHPDVHGAGEVTYLWEITGNLPGGAYPTSVPGLSPGQLDDCTRRYLDAIGTLSDSATRITDKLPHNFLHIGFINMILPDARIIHCMRDPRDTCLSIFFHRFNLNHVYSRDLGELGNYYRHYASLMRHWHAVSRLPILDLHYEELVDNFEDKVRTLLDFCGLD